MLYTSYFAKLNSLPDNITPISICGKAPDWYRGLQYKKLAPKYDFFMEWKRNHDNNYYIKCFNEQVLSSLSFIKTVNELQIMLPNDIKEKMTASFLDDENYHIALICYEKPSDFCHRHLVADWFKKNGFKCEEWRGK